MSSLNLPPTKSLCNPAAKIPSSSKSSSFFFVMYKVPRERKRERKKKTFRKLCAFQTTFNALRVTRGASLEKEEEYRAGKRYCVDDSPQTNVRKKRKRSVFPHQSREEGVGCRSTFSSSRRLKKAFKRAKTNSQKERIKKRTKKHTRPRNCVRAVFLERKLHFSKQTEERKTTTLILTRE